MVLSSAPCGLNPFEYIFVGLICSAVHFAIFFGSTWLFAAFRERLGVQWYPCGDWENSVTEAIEGKKKQSGSYTPYRSGIEDTDYYKEKYNEAYATYMGQPYETPEQYAKRVAQEIEDEDDPTVIVYYGSFEETDDVMDFGFDKFTTAEIYYPGQVVGQFPVTGGENSVVGEPAEAEKVIVPLNYNPADLVFSTEVLNGGLNAPVAVGDKIGTLRVWYHNVCLAQTDVLSLSVSKKDTMSTIFDGGVITDEESDKITGSFRTGVKIFVMLVAVVLVLSIGVAIYNAVIEMKRRKRRRNRRRSR
jgi:hypothetical protein